MIQLTHTSLEQFSTIYGCTLSPNVALQQRVYEAGAVITEVGSMIDGFYFLLSGTYYVTSPEANGKALLLRRCTTPAIIGDVELFQECSVQAQCEAITRCTFLFIPTAYYTSTLRFQAPFTELLLRELAFKLKTCTTLSRVNALSSVSVKLAAYLCTIHTEQQAYLIVEQPQHIADLIGTTTRHVNRILKRWEDDGILQRTQDHIHITQLDTLRDLSHGVRYV